MLRQKIVLVTSSQPSLNPRMVKEADALAEAGYEVIVVGQYWNDWATETDKTLLKSKRWRFIRVGGSPKDNMLIYFYTRIIHKVVRKCAEYIGLKFGIAELSIGRCSYQLYRTAVNLNADLYIGHNPGAMAIAALAAKKRKVKCGFDAEDFHRNEYSDDPNHSDVRIKTYLEEKYFPQYDYIITASPLISQEYSKHFPSLSFKTILNVFEKFHQSHSIDNDNNDKKYALKLFWFSQTVGHNRGLEDIIHAIHKCNTTLIELHILGNPRIEVILRINGLAESYHFEKNQINFYDPVPPDEVFSLASKFDVGMATEIGLPYNRDICLTNKIFTYLQSGLVIIASDTSAQITFYKENPSIGFIYEKTNLDSLFVHIKRLFDDRILLKNIKQNNYKLGNTKYNWGMQSIEFLKIIKNVLDKE